LYLNGIKVVIYGCLRVSFDMTPNGLRMSLFEFHARRFMEYVPRVALTTSDMATIARSIDAVLPSPINQFGVPLKVMRCLEMAEVCADMAALMGLTQGVTGPCTVLKALFFAPPTPPAELPNMTTTTKRKASLENDDNIMKAKKTATLDTSHLATFDL
jgi:hypothetical protein